MGNIIIMMTVVDFLMMTNDSQAIIHWFANRSTARLTGKAFYNGVEAVPGDIRQQRSIFSIEAEFKEKELTEAMSGDDQLPMLNHWQEEEGKTVIGGGEE